MNQSGLLTTSEVAKLTNENVSTVKRKIQRGEYTAATVKASCGQGGKQYLFDPSNLDLEARLKHFAQIEHGKIGPADIVGYKNRFGEDGLKTLNMRRSAVFEALMYENDGKGKVTARKEALATRLGITPRTLYRWVVAFQADGLAGLMDKTEQSNKGKPKALCLFAQDFAKAQLMGFTKRTNRSVYRKLLALDMELGDTACARCPHAEGTLARRELALQGQIERYPLCDKEQDGRLYIPECPTSFDRWANALPDDQLAYARYGKRYWEANYMPKAQRAKPEKVNECWFGDHHMFDLFVVADDGSLVRPWMTAWSDAMSGCFVGWCISTNPNSTTIAESFARAIPQKAGSPFCGMPSLIYIDNGKDYRSKRFEGEREVDVPIGRINDQLDKTSLIQALGVAVIHAQPYKAWSKIIERLFGTLENCYMRELPGWCGGRPSERPENVTRARLQKLADQGKLLTLRQFEKLMREKIIPAYHAERFENAQSPLEIYMAGEKARTEMVGWETVGIIKSEKCVRKVSYMGVKLNNTWYWDDAMRHMVGEEVTVLYSKTDLLSVGIVKDKRWVCEANIKDKLKLIGEDPAKLAAHMELQHNTRREVVEAIAASQRAVDVALRNVIYEQIDATSVGCGTITSTEYRKAAKEKVQKRAELAEIVQQDKDASDTVFNHFKQMGAAALAASNGATRVKK